MVEIFEVTEITEEIVRAFEELIPQLAPGTPPPSLAELEEMIASTGTVLFAARDEEILGVLALAFYRIPTGKKAWIEDVVVDNKARGKGVGEQLVLHAIGYAQERGYTKIELTSSPHRVAANRLYQKLGFAKRTTTVYRWQE